MNIKAQLTRKVGPLPVWAWGLVGGAGVGIGLYLRRRSSGSGDPLEPGMLVPVDSGAAVPYDVFPNPPVDPASPAVPADEPLPEEPFLPWLDFPLPELFDCPDGYLYHPLFNTCVPDPAFAVTPSPDDEPAGEAPRGNTPGKPNWQRKLRHINRRIKVLRKGGVTRAERAKLQALRKRRKVLRGRRK